MDFLLKVLTFFWLVRTIKVVLFWIYLWQLKNYHIGRFVDHFRTHQGKKLFYDKILGVKFIFLLLFFDSPIFLYFLLFVYAVEVLMVLVGIAKKRIKKPVFTFKTACLIFISIGATVVYAFLMQQYIKDESLFAYSLLVFDILVPIIISAIVLIVQPFFVLARNGTLDKATQKMRQFPNLKVIAITGSYGKTSTKEFLTTMLSAKFKVLATPDHINSEIGIAQTILQDLKPEHQLFIVEMGSYNKGGIKLLCDIVKPSIGVVTGVNHQHLATFGSLENLLSAEGGQELLGCLPKSGLLIVNGDNAHCLDLYKSAEIKKQIYTVQKNTLHSDIWTEEVTVKKDSLSFIARLQSGELAHFDVAVLGKQNVQNLLGAILVAKEFGMTFEEIALACKNIKPEQAGMTLKTGVHGINIIDSSYSSNPDGVMADLDYLSVFDVNPSISLRARKVIVMPCLIELGSESIKAHIEIGKKIAKVADLAIITTKDKFEEIKMAAMLNGMPEDKILLCDGSTGLPQANEIFSHITTFCKEGDAVLLEGRVPGELIRVLNGK